MKKVALIITMSIITILFTQWSLRDAIEFQPRKGLPNFFNKIKSKEKVNIGFIGGSITAANGWRPKTISLLKEYYEIDSLIAYSAAVGGTNSKYGVFRIDRHLLSKLDYDLIFVEFAVNDDSGTNADIEKSMEGIVRKIWKTNPNTDICFVYTVSPDFFSDIRNGKMNLSASKHDSIASYYGIPSIFWGVEVDSLIQSETVVWHDNISNRDSSQNESEQYVFTTDNIHPTDYGHQIYTNVLIESFKKIDTVSNIIQHEVKSPIFANNYENSKMLQGKEPNNHGLKIINSKFYADNTSSYYSFSFKGTELGLNLLFGPSGGKYIIEIDGVQKEYMNFDGYSSYYRKGPVFVKLSNDGEHFVKIYLSSNVLSLSEKRERLNSGSRKQDLDDNPEKYEKNELIFSDIFLEGEITNYFKDLINICEGDSITWQNNIYSEKGEYYVNYKTTNGFDSIYQLNLDTYQTYNIQESDTIEVGESLYWEGDYYDESGEYLANYQTIQGCDSIRSLKLFVDNVANINTNLSNDNITAFPNPVFEYLNFKNINIIGKEKNLEIFSVEGKKVFSKKIKQDEIDITINISHLSKGLYIYKIGELSNKFIKQ
jgi:hypothetical protein